MASVVLATPDAAELINLSVVISKSIIYKSVSTIQIMTNLTPHKPHIIMRRLLLTPLLTLLTVTLSVMASSKHDSDWDKEAIRRKATYTYAQGCIAMAQDSLDRGYRLLDRAYQLNPEDLDIVLARAQARMVVHRDSSSVEEYYQALLNEFNQGYDDYSSAMRTAYMAGQLQRYDDLVNIYECAIILWPAKTDATDLAQAYVLLSMTKGDTTAYNKAMAIYDRLERGVGINVGLSSQRIRAMSSRMDTLGIARELDRLISHMPDQIEALLYAGQAYHEIGRDSLAGMTLNRACTLDPTNGEALLTLAEYYEVTGDSVQALNLRRQALLSPEIEADSKFELMRDYLKHFIEDSAAYDSTRQFIQRVIEVTPGEPRLHALFGSYLGLNGDMDEMFEQFDYALDLDPANDALRSSYIQHLATSPEDSNRLLNLARKGMEVSPDNFYFPIMASMVFSQRGDYAGAYSLLDSVNIGEVKNNEAVSALITTKADMLQRIDSTGRALELYDRAILLDPNNYMAYNNAAYYMSVADNDLDKALKYARYAVLSDIDNPTYLDTYAWVYFKLKNFPEAKSYIDKALEALDYTLPGDSVVTDSVAVDNMPLDTVAVDPNKTGVVTSIDNIKDKQYEGIAEVLEHAGDIYFMYGLPDRAVEFWTEAASHGQPSDVLRRKVRDKTYYYK